MDNDDDDLYDVVDEDKYVEIVENRRRAGDFVVDDGEFILWIKVVVLLLFISVGLGCLDGLGYHDNGEEFIGGEDGADGE
jgi:hypothetical protein